MLCSGLLCNIVRQSRKLSFEKKQTPDYIENMWKILFATDATYLSPEPKVKGIILTSSAFPKVHTDPCSVALSDCAECL